LDSVNLSITLHSLDGQELQVYAHKSWMSAMQEMVGALRFTGLSTSLGISLTED